MPVTRVHDMGGRHGDGPVTPSPQDAPPFARPWHARACAVTLAAGALGLWSIDRARHARECLSPADYTRFGYYEKWIAALADLLVATGTVTREELRGAPATPSPLASRRLAAADVAPVMGRGSPYGRDGAGPRFAAGDPVRTRRPARNLYVSGGHTRLPAYAAGHSGTVIRCHGAHVLPDASAHGLGERPEPLYTVAFRAADLWGVSAHPADSVRLDLWESYLESP